MVLHCLFSWPFHEMRTITVTSVLQVWSQLTPVDSYSDRTGIQATFSPASWLPTLPPPTTLFDHHTMWLFKQQSLSNVLALGQEAKSRFWKTGPYLNFFWKAEREKQRQRQESFPIHGFTLQIAATTKWWARLRPSARNSIWVSPKRLVGIQLLESSALSPWVFISKKLDLGVDHGLKIQAFWYRM